MTDDDPEPFDDDWDYDTAPVEERLELLLDLANRPDMAGFLLRYPFDDLVTAHDRADGPPRWVLRGVLEAAVAEHTSHVSIQVKFRTTTPNDDDPTGTNLWTRTDTMWTVPRVGERVDVRGWTVVVQDLFHRAGGSMWGADAVLDVEGEYEWDEIAEEEEHEAFLERSGWELFTD